ncbi:HAUS augmin-like complex subunit 2 [Narcine bancroftii]|uniref:HAUS augmin-like complex subunit 2 n=1 Tax=Narcine bancroftii TaxID=1343680 RepID=UPI003831CCA5
MQTGAWLRTVSKQRHEAQELTNRTGLRQTRVINRTKRHQNWTDGGSTGRAVIAACRMRMLPNNPWDPTVPNPAASFLQKCLGSGILTQDVLEWNKEYFGNSVPFVQRFRQLAAISNSRAELQQKSLDIKLMQLQNDMADITHSKCLAEKYRCLQLMNSHLERILQEKMMLKQRLVKPICHQCLPVEANCHKYVSGLLTNMLQVINKLDTNLQLMKNLPLLSQKVKVMEHLMGRMVSEILELKEVMEFIMKWREQQKTIRLECLEWKQ